MKVFITVLLTLFTSLAFANMPATTADSNWITRANNTAPNEGLGSRLNKTKNMLVAVWDFAVQGGATGVIALNDDQGNLANLPLGALVTNVYAFTMTTATISGSTATMNLQAIATNDLLSSNNSLSAAISTGFGTINKLVAGVPANTTGTVVGPVTPQAGTGIAVNITASGTAAPTAGKVKFFIEYVNE